MQSFPDAPPAQPTLQRPVKKLITDKMIINKISSISHEKNYFNQTPAKKLQNKQETKEEASSFASGKTASIAQQQSYTTSNASENYQSTVERFSSRHYLENNSNPNNSTEEVKSSTETTEEIIKNQKAPGAKDIAHHALAIEATELAKFFAIAKSVRNGKDLRVAKIIKAYEINQ